MLTFAKSECALVSFPRVKGHFHLVVVLKSYVFLLTRVFCNTVPFLCLRVCSSHVALLRERWNS